MNIQSGGLYRVQGWSYSVVGTLFSLLSLCYLLPRSLAMAMAMARLLAMAPHIQSLRPVRLAKFRFTFYLHYSIEGYHNIWPLYARRISCLLPNLSAFEVCSWLAPNAMLSVSLQLQCDCGIRVSRFDSQGYDFGLRWSITSLSLLGVTQKLRIWNVGQIGGNLHFVLRI